MPRSASDANTRSAIIIRPHPQNRYWHQMDATQEHDPATLARIFTAFAEREAQRSSPLYERLARGVAVDPAVLALAAHARPGQPVPNLLFAAVHYLLLGEAASPIQISCAWQGTGRPPIPDPLPAVTFRLGLDLNPVDVRDPDAIRWLRALVWPEHCERADLLQRALAVVQQDPPDMRAGDA